MIKDDLRAQPLPCHVAIIMDGNGRWAKRRGFARTAGHKEGLTAAKRIVAAAAALGIQYVTLYTFSTENWKRAESEVGYLMGLIQLHLRAEFDFYRKNGIRIVHVGDLNGLPQDVQQEILKAVQDTAHFTGTTCVLAINYGGRDELVRGVRRLIACGVKCTTGNGDVDAAAIIRSAALTEADVGAVLDTAGMPDVDLLIRTGGEKRLSNFLLWQAAYAELVFRDTLWPDYDEDEFYADIAEFQKRSRRFGAVSD